MYIHQSSMQNGSLKIVIEPQSSSSWVPAEIAGNDFRQWQLMHFPIGRVSQDFQIVFEVMPRGLVGSQRGHVSIDNLSLKGCFPEGPRTDTCSNALVKCQKNKRDQCLKTVSVCDIDVDCDDKEDELLNCGISHRRSFFEDFLLNKNFLLQKKFLLVVNVTLKVVGVVGKIPERPLCCGSDIMVQRQLKKPVLKPIIRFRILTTPAIICM